MYIIGMYIYNRICSGYIPRWMCECVKEGELINLVIWEWITLGDVTYLGIDTAAS